MPTPAKHDLTAMRERAEEASQLLKALGNPQRLRVLCLLADQEMSVGQINEQLPDLSQSALSQHLAKLRDEGLVRTRRESQTIWYTLAHGPTEQIIATLYGIYCAPDQAPLCAPPPRKRTGSRK
ncbi:ArsR/SmtB family transcription factor [Rhodanobacter aciditrophus]|uniref:ArsR/SmtB family transcription factor n=1 Tax=Rhodanobacter aciditrophus TaxID=1623218 RepID=UPI003CEB9FFB